MFYLFGPKTISLFDVWSIDHFIAGISVGVFSIKLVSGLLNKYLISSEGVSEGGIPSKLVFILASFVVLFLAYFWETIEHYLETGLAGPHVAYWFQGVEFWMNRIIFDPLLVWLGFWLGSKFPKLVWPARIFSLSWLLLHVFLFPHSMYLQDLLIGTNTGFIPLKF